MNRLFDYHARSAIVSAKQDLSTDQFRVSLADLLAEVAQSS
jgi:hypothetical protein